MKKELLSLLSLLAAIILAFVGCWIAPAGIIDTSVLWFIAQMLVYSATIIGINLNLKDVFRVKEKEK